MLNDLLKIRKETPRLGVSAIAWSSDSNYIATKNDTMPHNIWIWKTSTMQLHSVIGKTNCFGALHFIDMDTYLLPQSLFHQLSRFVGALKHAH